MDFPEVFLSSVPSLLYSKNAETFSRTQKYFPKRGFIFKINSDYFYTALRLYIVKNINVLKTVNIP